MSGNFVQRGEPAVLDKYTRAKWAVLAGADIVIELPAVFSLAPAPDFAYGGVKLLTDMKCVEYLSFGSEFGDIERLKEFAENTEKADISVKLKQGKAIQILFLMKQAIHQTIFWARILKGGKAP
jgi:predicted nucleotidyltransferase